MRSSWLPHRLRTPATRSRRVSRGVAVYAATQASRARAPSARNAVTTCWSSRSDSSSSSKQRSSTGTARGSPSAPRSSTACSGAQPSAAWSSVSACSTSVIRAGTIAAPAASSCRRSTSGSASAHPPSWHTRSCGEARASACDASGLCVIACSFAQYGGREPAVGAGRLSDPPVAAASLQRMPVWEATVPYNACVPQAPGGPVLLLGLRHCANPPVCARIYSSTLLLGLRRAQTCCMVSPIGKWFVQQEEPCVWAIPASRKGRSRRPRCRRPPFARLVSRARRGDPDRFGVTTRAVTAPARAGPEVVPRAGRAALHGRRAALRAGRPRLGPYSHLLQGALAVEPAHPLAVRVFTAGQRDFPRLLFRPAQPHRALADGALSLLHGLALLGILRLVGDEATHVFAGGADEKCPVRPSALDEEASSASLHHALWAIERPCRPGCCCPPLPAPTTRQRLHRRAGDLRDEVGNHRAHLTHERLTLVRATHHPRELLLPLPRHPPSRRLPWCQCLGIGRGMSRMSRMVRELVRGLNRTTLGVLVVDEDRRPRVELLPHLPDFGSERDVLGAVVGALAGHERFDNPAQRVGTEHPVGKNHDREASLPRSPG